MVVLAMTCEVIAQRLSGAPTAAVLGFGTALPGTGSIGISPASGVPVQPRKRRPLVVAADGDPQPPGRVGASHDAQDAASNPAAPASWLDPAIARRLPGEAICPA